MAVLSAIPHFEGSILPNTTTAVDVRFASLAVLERAEAVYGLWRVMLGWEMTYREMSETGWRARNSLVELLKNCDLALVKLETDVDHAEFHVIYWYIECFTDTFALPPILPHRHFEM